MKEAQKILKSALATLRAVVLSAWPIATMGHSFLPEVISLTDDLTLSSFQMYPAAMFFTPSKTDRTRYCILYKNPVNFPLHCTDDVTYACNETSENH